MRREAFTKHQRVLFVFAQVSLCRLLYQKYLLPKAALEKFIYASLRIFWDPISQIEG